MKFTFNNETVSTFCDRTDMTEFDNAIEFKNFTIIISDDFLRFYTNYDMEFLFIKLKDYNQFLNIEEKIQNILDVNAVLIIKSLKEDIDSEYKRRESYIKQIKECKDSFNKQYEKIITFL